MPAKINTAPKYDFVTIVTLIGYFIIVTLDFTIFTLYLIMYDFLYNNSDLISHNLTWIHSDSNIL